MKKSVIILGLIIYAGIGANSFCFALPTTAAIIDKVETSLFGYTYSNEAESKRLDRIEQEVYGKTSAGTSKERLTKLGKDLSADNLGKEIAPKEDTFAQESDRYKDEESYMLSKQGGAGNTGTTVGAAAPAAGPGVDYPVINELENIVFNQEFKSNDLNARLDKLEEKTFKKTYAGEDFSTRVDRLRAKINPQSLRNETLAQDGYYYDDQPMTALSRNGFLPAYRSPNAFDYDYYNSHNTEFNYGRAPKKVSINAIETARFKRTYVDDTMESRLARLENNMFGTTFADDSEQERVNRLSSAFKATKSSPKYDSNKFQQNLATGMQIGMFILMMLACIL